MFALNFQTCMKPSIPRGTRDFGPSEMRRRRFIFDVLRNNFELYGYEPLETPAVENIETLTGKYGEEGDQLIYKILNSRMHESRDKEDLIKDFTASLDKPTNTPSLTEKALRYDLTVPFARYVAMNHGQLVFPFRRYQMQPVWRADKPQKGRYREFWQCDADVIGTTSLIAELELLSLIGNSFTDLKVPALIKVNNRKVLTGIAQVAGEEKNVTAITVAIDKLEKIGIDQVKNELLQKGISSQAISILEPLMTATGSNEEKLAMLKKVLSGNAAGEAGIAEIEFLLSGYDSKGCTLELDITLARGLNYYTGAIFEAVATQGTLRSSILGGGRYDDLTGIFGVKGLSGVGISFGIDRIYDVMNELALFPAEIAEAAPCRLLFAHFDETTRTHCLGLAASLRQNNISCEVYPDVVKKFPKQLEYANKKKIPFVIVVGGDEMNEKKYTVKDMTSGTQDKKTVHEIIHAFNKK
jgi:histidyl-tRNA synthetase